MVKLFQATTSTNSNGDYKIENLPEVIEGYLDLSSNKITKIENLPEVIRGDLHLK